jgi:hypothetical protein
VTYQIESRRLVLPRTFCLIENNILSSDKKQVGTRTMDNVQKLNYCIAFLGLTIRGVIQVFDLMQNPIMNVCNTRTYDTNDIIAKNKGENLNLLFVTERTFYQSTGTPESR